MILLYAFIGDLIFYWYHRTQHSVPALWTIHELHHSDDELNATSSLRRYLLERPLQFVLISLPTAILFSQVPILHWLRLTAEEGGQLFLVTLVWLFFAHANLRLALGRWSWIATGPQLHRIHHSVQPEHQGKNFAQFFPIIDVMFGTYRAPKRDEFPRTGTIGLAGDVSVGRALRRPLVRILQASRWPIGREKGVAGAGGAVIRRVDR